MNKERFALLIVTLVLLLSFSFVLLEYNALVIQEINSDPIIEEDLIVKEIVSEKSIYYSNPEKKDLKFEYFIMALLILLLILAFVTLKILKNHQRTRMVRGI